MLLTFPALCVVCTKHMISGKRLLFVYSPPTAALCCLPEKWKHHFRVTLLHLLFPDPTANHRNDFHFNTVRAVLAENVHCRNTHSDEIRLTRARARASECGHVCEGGGQRDRHFNVEKYCIIFSSICLLHIDRNMYVRHLLKSVIYTVAYIAPITEGNPRTPYTYRVRQ